MKGSLFSIVAASALVIGLTLNQEIPSPDFDYHVLKDTLAQMAPHQLFKTADACMSCHNGVVTPAGQDISFGVDWRASMMANSARDPYWQAAVRREVMDHPEEQETIEDECATCHMPMARFEANAAGQKGGVFEHLPVGQSTSEMSLLAADGVSCTTCHQITQAQLGTRESFVGGFDIDTETPMGQRSVFGPYTVNSGKSAVMHSASGFRQAESNHIQQSELCATCHTLITKTLGPGGEVIGELPEQVPYLEWQHSAYREERSCQSCHMPVVEDSTAIASVLGELRPGVSRHVFRGGNFFMLRMLNRYRSQLGVEALPHELDAAVARTEQHLQSSSAWLAIENAHIVDGRLISTVHVENLAGHKLPTAYPSRRVWIHYTVRDRNGRLVFESGKLQPTGLIAGNDNDEDPTRYEPHYTALTRSDQVQVYESVMVDSQGNLTTGLLSALHFVKDNRLLPRGFDKETAEDDFAVRGEAQADENFMGGSDKTVYSVDVTNFEGPFRVEAALWYQPVGYRWAKNLASYDAPETNRFSQYYDSMSDVSGIMMASQATTVE